MTNDEEKFPTIWRFLSGLMEPEAPLCDWRLILGDQVDFEKFKNKYLLPTDKLAVKIYCPEPCNSGCRFREISDPFDDVREAVCMEYMDSYPIEDNDIRIKMFRDDVLFTEAAQVMGIATKTMAVLGVDYTWELGCVPGYPKIPVYGTLLCIGYELLNLFSVLNRKTKGPYILLVTNDSLIKPANKQLLDDYRSSYVALNKTVKFNADAELELIGDFDLKNLVALPHVEVEASSPPKSNRIRKETRDDSDYWFVDGELKKVYHRGKTNSIQSKILNILSDQFGIGWIPHQTFMNATGWTVDEYFGNGDDSGRMQKQLFVIRRDLGIEIIFSREYGVKLSSDMK